MEPEKGSLVAAVMAAGKGTRMKSSLPKVLHKVCGLSMLDHVLDALAGVHAKTVYLIVGHGADAVLAAAGDRATAVIQEPQLGTGHAVLQVLPHLEGHDGDVMVVSADVPLMTSEVMAALYDHHFKTGATVTLLSARVPGSPTLGRVVRDGHNDVAAIIEVRDAMPHHLEIDEVNSGTYVFKASFLKKYLPLVGRNNAQNELYLTDLIGLAANAHLKIEGLCWHDAGVTLGINSRSELAEVDGMLRKRILDKHMKNGVTVLDPATTYVDASVQIGSDSTLLPGTMLQGATKIGSDCEIGPYSRLVDSQVGDRCTIQNSILLSSTMGNECTIGPFAYLRPGNKLGDKVKVGDFVELKNAQIGNGSKVPHLAYVGDATLGMRVNIGAGTITANYDGKNKHHTTLEDDVHIGANTNLVAPVRVGARSKTGAGTVVTRDVPEDSTAVGVPARLLKTIAALKRPLLWIILAAFLTRLYQIGAPNVWMDESFSYWLAHLRLSTLWAALPFDTHPPLYPLLLHVWDWLVSHISKFGATAGSLRLHSAILGCVTTWCVVRWATLAVDARTGWIAGATYAVSSAAFSADTQIGNMALASLLTAAACWRLLAAQRSDERRDWMLYAALLLLLLYTDYLGLTVLAAHLIYGALSRLSKGFWMAFAAAVIAWLPWLARAVQQYKSAHALPHAALPVDFLWKTFAFIGGDTAIPGPRGLMVGVALLSVVLVLASPFVHGGPRNLLALIAFAVPALALVVVSRAPNYNWLAPRELGIVVPAFCVLAGTTFDGMFRWKPMLPLALALVVAWAGMNLVGSRNLASNHDYMKQQWRDVALFVSKYQGAGDAIILVSGYAAFPFNFYYSSIDAVDWQPPPRGLHILQGPGNLPQYALGGYDERAIDALDRLPGRIWLITCQDELYDPQHQIAKGLLSKRNPLVAYEYKTKSDAGAIHLALLSGPVR